MEAEPGAPWEFSQQPIIQKSYIKEEGSKCNFECRERVYLPNLCWQLVPLERSLVNNSSASRSTPKSLETRVSPSAFSTVK